MNEDISIELKS